MKAFRVILGIIIAVVGVIVAAVLLGGVKVLQFQTMAEAPQPEAAESVSVTRVQDTEWESVLKSVGSVTAVEGTTLRTEVAGIIESIRFEPGAEVRAGAVLIELDRSIQEANLRQATAGLDLARRSLRRTRDLFQTQSVPEAELDQAEGRVAEAEAQVAAQEAALAKRTIRAPFDGRLGIKQISIGQYLNPGDAVVALQSVDPVYIEFSLPQRELGQVQEGYEVRAAVDSHPEVPFRGELTAINPQLDPATRNVRIQATFRNPEGQLRPGMFASVEVVLPEKRQTRIIPATAVVFAPFGDSVYVVDEEEGALSVRQQFVRLGARMGDFVEVLQGLSDDERIVSAGAFKLRQGMPIRISEVGTIEPSLRPTPEDS